MKPVAPTSHQAKSSKLIAKRFSASKQANLLAIDGKTAYLTTEDNLIAKKRVEGLAEFEARLRSGSVSWANNPFAEERLASAQAQAESESNEKAEKAGKEDDDGAVLLGSADATAAARGEQLDALVGPALVPAGANVAGLLGGTAAISQTGSAGGAAAPSAPLLVTKTLVDGPIRGATVFLDLNKNGLLDAGEASTTTDANGNFTFTDAQLAEAVAAGAVLVALPGGVDTTTGVISSVSFMADVNAGVISPLTTLMVVLTEQDPSLSLADAETMIKQAFGLPADIDLASFNPFAADLPAELSTAAVQVQAAAAAVASLVEIVTVSASPNFADDNSFLTQSNVQGFAFSGIADLIAQTAATAAQKEVARFI